MNSNFYRQFILIDFALLDDPSFIAFFNTAEFGTYAPLRVLQALRAENRAHHWGQPNDAGTRRAKRQLRETFAPADEGWRNTTVTRGLDIVRQAFRAGFR